MAVGGAPQLSTKSVAVKESEPLAAFAKWIRGALKLTENDSLFLFVNGAFMPPLDTTIKDLSDCFGRK